jgi:voltage-gated potassium channel Kch
VPHWLASASAIAFYLFTAASILVFVLKQHEITADTVYGALSVYLLIGITWSFAYTMIEHLAPGSFYIDPSLDTDGILERADFYYYSFVTLTTLGYGDILPITAQSRSLAALEAVCGVLYTATLVASLVGRLSSRPKKS